MVRQRTLTPSFVGSIPTYPAKIKKIGSCVLYTFIITDKEMNDKGNIIINEQAYLSDFFNNLAIYNKPSIINIFYDFLADIHRAIDTCAVFGEQEKIFNIITKTKDSLYIELITNTIASVCKSLEINYLIKNEI